MELTLISEKVKKLHVLELYLFYLSKAALMVNHMQRAKPISMDTPPSHPSYSGTYYSPAGLISI